MGQFIPREEVGVRGVFSLDPQFGLQCFCKSQVWMGASRPAGVPHPTLVAGTGIESRLSSRLMLEALHRAEYRAPRRWHFTLEG